MATIEDSFRLQLSRATGQDMTVDSAKAKVALHRSDTQLKAGVTQQLPAGTEIEASNTGDHPLVLELLQRTHQSSQTEDFQSRLDEPLYAPSDRLLLRRREQLIGHVQVSKQIGWFHGQRCPLARLQDFVTLPEYRSSELDSALLKVAESAAVSEGAIVGFIRSDRPEWFEQHGWSRCRGQGHTRANTRSILAHVDAPRSKGSSEADTIEVRTWRHYELDKVLEIYQQLSTNMWGARQRSLEMWQWLVGRKAHDQILIAVESNANAKPSDAAPGKSGRDNLSNIANVVGFAILRDSCIVEMLTLPGHASVRSALLRQACRDAIDRDHHYVSLHSPAADPMHELLVTAGGTWIADSAASDGQWMLKLLSPGRWIERLYPVLHERAREAGVTRPLEIDFAMQDQCQRLMLTRRSSRLAPTVASTVAVQCNWHAFQDLLTSNLTFPEAIAQGRLRTPHLSILRTLAALFPPKLLWHSPFPQLRL